MSKRLDKSLGIPRKQSNGKSGIGIQVKTKEDDWHTKTDIML